MGLTDPGPLVLAAMLLLALLVSSVLDRPRPRGSGLALLARGGRVLGAAALSVLVFALVLNNQYLFYTSWGDLLGPASVGRVHAIGNAAAARGRVAGPGLTGLRSPSSLPALPQPGQRMQTYHLTSPDAQGTALVLVELPAGYDPRSARTYPVVLGLHGFPSSPQSFAHAGILDGLDQGVQQGRLGPCIVVIPQINVPNSLDTECVNGGPGQPQVDTWLGQTLPRWVVAHFRVRTDRLSWATMGYSFGGWCAASLAMRHPGTFGAAVVFQGYFRPDFGAGYTPAGSALAGYDLVRLEERSPVAESLWVLTSRQDGLSYPSTARFLRAVRTPTSVTATVLAQGGHRLAVWQPFIPNAVSWLGRTLPGFHA